MASGVDQSYGQASSLSLRILQHLTDPVHRKIVAGQQQERGLAGSLLSKASSSRQSCR